jgi:hypothetical protein
MEAPVLLLAPVYTDDSEALWKAALKAGWRVERVRGWEVPAGLQGQNVAYYGFLRPVLATMLMDSLGRVLLEPPLEWLPSLPDPFLKRTVRFASLGDARRLTVPAFVKPAEDKHFPARVYARGTDLPPDGRFSDALPVLISDPVDWEVEYRCFVLGGSVLTLSPYWRHGILARTPDGRWPCDPSEAQEASDFARTVLESEKVMAPPALVLDIGRIAGRGWAIVEANPAWASALYGCPPGQVLSVVARACRARDQMPAADRQWVISRQAGTLTGYADGGEEV